MLADMMWPSGTRWDVGYELIRWGDDAVPHIVDFIGLSTKDSANYEEHTLGEDMTVLISSIRAEARSAGRSARRGDRAEGVGRRESGEEHSHYVSPRIFESRRTQSEADRKG